MLFVEYCGVLSVVAAVRRWFVTYLPVLGKFVFVGEILKGILQLVSSAWAVKILGVSGICGEGCGKEKKEKHRDIEKRAESVSSHRRSWCFRLSCDLVFSEGARSMNNSAGEDHFRPALPPAASHQPQ